MLFFEVFPLTTLASSVNGKTSKKSMQNDAAVLGVSRPLGSWVLTHQDRFHSASSVKGLTSKNVTMCYVIVVVGINSPSAGTPRLRVEQYLN